MQKKRDKIKDLLVRNGSGAEALVEGWVRTRRDSKGGFSFLEVNDGSCLANIQVVVDHQLPCHGKITAQLTTGCCVSVQGRLVASQGKGQAVEVHADNVKIYGAADPDNFFFF